MRCRNQGVYMGLVLTITALMLASAMPAAATGYTVLHNFTGGTSDGDDPRGALTMSGSTLYGMTRIGGSSNLGTVFKMNSDGTGFELLHSFTGGAADGSLPYGDLTLSGATLYGMSYQGGEGYGTVFKISTDNTGFSLLHSFSQSTAPGGIGGVGPYGSLTLSGSTLYGMTELGGDGRKGTVFKINTDGSGFYVLHEFDGATADGARPLGDLTLSGSTLYGMTSDGGSSDDGAVFTMNTDGTGFSLLHSFTGGADDGAGPWGDVTLAGSKLYGMTQGGGSSNYGTIFSMNTDGTGFSLLHSFTDNDDPNGSLTLSGSILYGMTEAGGEHDDGAVFAINTDGTGFTLLHSFDSSFASPPTGSWGMLTLSDSTLYGMMSRGGSNNDGLVFSLEVPEPTTLLLVGTGALGVLAGTRRRRRR